MPHVSLAWPRFGDSPLSYAALPCSSQCCHHNSTRRVVPRVSLHLWMKFVHLLRANLHNQSTLRLLWSMAAGCGVQTASHGMQPQKLSTGAALSSIRAVKPSASTMNFPVPRLSLRLWMKFVHLLRANLHNQSTLRLPSSMAAGCSVEAAPLGMQPQKLSHGAALSSIRAADPSASKMNFPVGYRARGH